MLVMSIVRPHLKSFVKEQSSYFNLVINITFIMMFNEDLSFLYWDEKSTMKQVEIEKQRKREAYQCMNPETSIQVKRTHLAKSKLNILFLALENENYIITRIEKCEIL